MFQVNGEKKEKKSKKKGTGQVEGGGGSHSCCPMASPQNSSTQCRVTASPVSPPSRHQQR